MQIKSMRAQVKAADAGFPFGGFEVILSDSSTDRDGEVVDAHAFDPLPDHITFDIDHGLSVVTTVGSGVPIYEGDQLIVRGTYASTPLAQEVRTLVNEGHIRTTSVAFMGAVKETKDGKAHITKAELLNGSFVPIPSNRGALVLASKSAKAGARNNASDAANLQQIHDLSVSNGADCSGMAKGVGRRWWLKATTVAGSYEDLQEDLQEAVVDAHGPDILAAYPDADPGDYGYLVNIVATFPDHVVYQIGWDSDAGWQASYTWDGEQATLGAPEPVQIDQVVTPAPAGTPKSARKPKDATGAGDDDGQQQQHLELRARALALLAKSA